ncbi:MAG: glutathione S-transferase [Rhodospirillaceae bacterium]|nr:glutathione S-transferase [Rhodospirillaceae bacterium]
MLWVILFKEGPRALSDIILHHYPQSPVSEKVRVVFGLKDLDWRSVTIPRLPPKPDLMPLTGGYRLTPVMQIGADVYCDSHSIIRELERLKPEPTLFPGGVAGMAWGVGQWTDGPLFMSVIALVFGDAGDDLPDDFREDRGALYFGAGYDVARMTRDLPATLAQIRAQLQWMDDRLKTRDFMLGAEPGLPDALCYYLVWFIRGRYSKGPGFLSQFENLVEWEKRIEGFGHGRPADMDSTEALAVAKAAVPDVLEIVETGEGDPSGLKPGDEVKVEPIGVGLPNAVAGRIVRIGAQEIAIARADEQVGDVVVHFPRVGYRVSRGPGGGREAGGVPR